MKIHKEEEEEEIGEEEELRKKNRKEQHVQWSSRFLFPSFVLFGSFYMIIKFAEAFQVFQEWRDGIIIQMSLPNISSYFQSFSFWTIMEDEVESENVLHKNGWKALIHIFVYW